MNNSGLIIFSGDLVDRGGSSFKNDMILAFLTFEEKVLKRAQKELNIDRNKCIISPGNHDICRNLDSDTIESGLASNLIDANTVRKFQDSTNSFNELQRIRDYKKFELSLYEGFKDVKINTFETIHQFNISGKKVIVLSLNTSWRCCDSEKDKGNLILGESQIINHNDSLEEAEIKIAVMHHSFHELKDFEKERIKNLLNKNFNLVLTGHVHLEDGFAFQNDFGETIYSTASSNSEYNSSLDTKYENAYSIIDVSEHETTLTFRKYSSRKLKYIPNLDIGDDEGKIIFETSSKEAISQKKRIKEIIDNINKLYEDSVNHHLLSFQTDTNAPKNIDSLFVMPRITSNKIDNEENKIDLTKKVEKEYDLKELCFHEDNIIFTGQKETGKTILLDKLFLELSSNYTKYSKIPVLLNYSEVKKSNILQLISNFLNVPVKELRNGLLEKERILLMIDDLDLYQDNPVLNKMDRFLENYPNVKIFCTATAFKEDTIQLQQISYDFLRKSIMMCIENFRTREIHELIKKWFKNADINKRQIEWSIENIVDKFNKLSLPSTPMAVSMFLWIFEKQDTYAPVNNAQMLENFLERLFRKNEQELVFSSEFTYRNKEFLLTNIAYFMYENNNSEYSLDYEKLRTFIVNYLRNRMFSFSADDILNEFLNIGILIDVKNIQNRTIKFRFSCFFHFYLMKNIDLKPEFKENILKGDNCIKFMNELDYYTGLNMNDNLLLKEITEKMSSRYESINQVIVDNSEYSYDTFLETTESFTDLLTDEKIENITTKIKKIPDNSTKVNDNILETADKKSKEIGIKENQINPVELLHDYWILAGTILRNSEEIEDSQLKKDSLKSVVECSLTFATLFKFILIKELKEYEDNSNKDKNSVKNLKALSLFLPNLHQEVLTQILGSSKLSIAFKERLDLIIENPEISDFEKFAYTFLIFDLNDIDKYTYLNKLVKNRKRIYTKDIIFLKLIHQFYSNNISDPEEKKLKNIIAELKAKYPNQKGEIINELNKKKLLDSTNKNKTDGRS